MTMRGRKPKPTELHRIHGTFRKDRHGGLPPLPQVVQHAELTPEQARQRAEEMERMRRALGLPERRQDER
jgi:hypothetical protein